MTTALLQQPPWLWALAISAATVLLHLLWWRYTRRRAARRFKDSRQKNPLHGSEQAVLTIIDQLPARISQFDRRERVLYANRYCGTVYGCEPAALLGRTIREVRGEKAYASIKPHIERVMRGEYVRFDHSLEVAGQVRYYQQDYVPDLAPDGSVRGFFSISFEITDRHRTEQQLDRLARTDALTGLINRREFEHRLSGAMGRSRRTGKTMALMFLDIDYFKSINDNLGHAAGDEVLKIFGQRLLESVRETDTVARFAGDEFVVILESMTHRDDAVLVAQKIIESARDPFQLADCMHQFSVSLGLAYYQGPGQAAEALLAEADGALYAAKDAGRNTWRMAAAPEPTPAPSPQA